MDDVLREFVGEEVVIITNMSMTTEIGEGPEGAIVGEVPICADGQLVSYDDMFILLQDVETMRPSIINIENVVKIELAASSPTKAEVAMSDPSKPQKKDMS